jgi:hypothetical protein
LYIPNAKKLTSRKALSFPDDWKDQSMMDDVVKYKGHKDAVYFEAKRRLDLAAQTIQSALDDNQLDALVFCDDNWAPAAAATGGFPIVSVRSLLYDPQLMGWSQGCAPFTVLSNGEPFGIRFIARRDAEPVLLGLL